MQEIADIIGDSLVLMDLSQVGYFGDIPEDQDTLEGNALQKAKFIYDRYHLDTIADDTGLFVPTLGGEPGVFSARYARNNNSILSNVDFLLSTLQGIENRAAYFRTIFALITTAGVKYFEGICEGRIIEQAKGSGGFGYDAVFVPNGFEETFAEMDAKIKNSVSHRFKALYKLRGYLEGLS